MLDTRFVRGMGTGLYVSEAFAAGVHASLPEVITLTNTVDAAAGATELTLSASAPTVLEANQILHFGDVAVVVMERTPVDAATSVPVEGMEGLLGDGIPAAIAADAEADWNQMFRVLGTEDSSLGIDDDTSDLTSVTYDSGQSMAWRETQITGKGWTMDRSGRFKPRDKSYKIVRTAMLTGREVYVLRLLPDEDGQPAAFEHGRANVTGPTIPAPASGIIDLNFTFTGQGQLYMGDIEDL